MMNPVHDSQETDDDIDHQMLREQWTRDINRLMVIVLLAAAVVITIGIIAGIFDFSGASLIYILFCLSLLSWWGASHKKWYWARIMPGTLCFGLGGLITYFNGYDTLFVLYFALAVILAGMLFGTLVRWLTVAGSIVVYTLLGLNTGANLVDSLDRVVTFSFGMLTVSLLQGYYHNRFQNMLTSQMKSNLRLMDEIARREQVEIRLKEQSEQTRRLADNTTDLISEIGPDGTLRYASPSYKTELGYSPEDLQSLVAYDLLHPDDVPKAQDFMGRIFETLKPQSVQLQTRHHDGRYIPFEVLGSPLFGQNGTLTGLMLSGRDISKQKVVEAALQASESKFRTIIEALPLGVNIYSLRADGELALTDFNPAAKEILGVELSELLGVPIEQAFPGLANLPLLDRLREIARSGGLLVNEIVDYHDERIKGQYEVQAFQTAPGTLVAVLMDVTERIQAAEALRQSEEKFSKAFSISPDSININRLSDGVYIEINQGFTQLTGYTREDVAGKSSLDLKIWDDPADRARLVRGLQECGVVENLEATFRRKNGERALGVMSAAVVTLNNEVCILSTTRDMTERIEAQRALQIAHDQLEDAYDLTLEGWARALELRERETASHSRRVVELTLDIARAAGLGEEALVHIKRGALLHDIGKLGVPDHVLLKPGPLSSDEWALMREHPLLGKKLLNDIPYLRPSIAIPYGHHEHWDGSGYPLGLHGSEIPLEARIFSVVDVWDALISDRPYRKAWSAHDVRVYIKAQRGMLFDPYIVDLFLDLEAISTAQ